MWASRNAGYGKFKSWGGRSTDRTSDSSCQIGDSSSCSTSLVFVGSVPTSAHRAPNRSHNLWARNLWAMQVAFKFQNALILPIYIILRISLQCPRESGSLNGTGSLEMLLWLRLFVVHDCSLEVPPSHWHLKKEQVKFLFFMFLFLLIIWLRLWVLRKWPCTIVSY